ncbi:MAG: tRNA pseudouridine(38-40) synthase TruA [Candidatus Izemoplasmataceae bacterium]
MKKEWGKIEELLKKSILEDEDYKYFTNHPYYRSTKGQLCDDYESMKALWPERIVRNDIRVLEDKEHMLYYKMKLDEKESLYGKILFDGHLIHYLYETMFDDSMKRYFCVVAYDGSGFEGYQKQLIKRTVQGVLEEALHLVFHKETQVHASGRTDKGVHANHQTIHFDAETKIPLNSLKMVIKQYLPEDIVIKSIEEKPPVFHSRYDVTSKTYMYHLDYGVYDVTKRNYRWFVNPFQVENFKKALSVILGKHDFASFTKTTDKHTVREVIDVSFEENGTEIKVWIKGKGFLRYMVRNLIMAAYLIATEELSISMEELLRSKDNTLLRHIASPSGLYLYDVSYD